jgi:methionine biosynthesis protein MetW
MSRHEDPTRFSYEEISRLVSAGSTVLDLGCGDGELLLILEEERSCRGRGVDKQEDMVLACISKGLSVFQGDLDEGLKDYPSQSYDYVILNQTLQMLQDPRFILEEMIRVGRKIIVNFPNFGHWQARFQLMLGGRMPQNKQLPIPWYKTPNIHFCTRKDFIDLCGDLNLRIVDEICLNSAGRRLAVGKNAMATQVCMLLESKKA